ncbi:MAG: dTMP kinase [Candidatus Geothermincolia bacterium]
MDNTEVPAFIRGPHDLAGKFITFEGCEGCGKTTQATLLEQYLLDQGRDVILCREPGGTALGERIRDILLDPACADMVPITEALLFAADRAQQVMQVIRPALAKGWIVIADRFTDSSLAYQGVGRGCGLEAVKNLNEWACGNIEPNLTIFLDLKVRDGLARAVGPEGHDRIEQESVEFHENVRHAYSMLIRIFSHRYRVIDALGTPEMVRDRVVDEVSKVI